MSEYNHHRANMRNFLVGLTMAELHTVLDETKFSGPADNVGYIEEFIREVEAEFAG